MQKIFIFLCLLILVGSQTVSASEERERFKDNGDGTIIDAKSKLMWIKKPNFFGDLCKQKKEELACNFFPKKDLPLATWKIAEVTLKVFSFAGHSDWRLPTREEADLLIRIAQQQMNNPFGSILSMYWTSSPIKVGRSYWMVFPIEGIAVPMQKDTVGFIWPVRDLE